MSLTLEQWHQRYQQQAQWTSSLRKYIFDRVDIRSAKKMLEVGCGTGALLGELYQNRSGLIFGLDIDLNAARFANRFVPQSIISLGDANHLPFQSASFDITLCHFLLLWIRRPQTTLGEMCRVTRPGGYILAMAEPDYGGRLDFPAELSELGRWQREALLEQGTDPFIGRKLRSLFHNEGLQNVEAGVLGGQWKDDLDETDFELEWSVITSDLAGKIGFQEHGENLKSIELSARREHRRVLYVPTFYAIGRVAG